uniref:tRNA-uridine aminocarboxypropyltransferase n=1 Tax=Elaeis guineensis var. tenera TaxID=51953 RepID=A0A8N4F6J0_ELAGV|nr:uncharacterized protein LOC105048366 isoform X2 [Elaeis guineensis]
MPTTSLLCSPPPPADLRRSLPPHRDRRWPSLLIFLRCFPSHRSPIPFKGNSIIPSFGTLQLNRHRAGSRGPVRAVLATRCFLASSPLTVPKTWPALRAGSPRGSSSMAEGAEREKGEGLSLKEWQGWGTSSPVPAMVAEVVEDLRALERETGTHMSFGGLGGKLQGSFKVHEDIKHRAVYDSLTDPEKKLQFFAARQIACRVLGNRGYLCQKDFLRQNNTGKLLWQIFGIQAATLCLFGIPEHEEIMWDAFRHSGKGMVWFLYPNKSLSPKSVHDIFLEEPFTGLEDQTAISEEKPSNFVLIDGTWSNSAAMYRRLKDRWTSLCEDEDLPCISLSTLGASLMHKLRPQPSWDRTCTAAAAAGLLSELHLCPELSVHGLDEQAEAVEDAIDVLLHALTTRRLRRGRPITRKDRHLDLIK